MKKLNISQDFSFKLFSTKRKKKNLRNKEENLLKFVFLFQCLKESGGKDIRYFFVFFKEKKKFPLLKLFST